MEQKELKNRGAEWSQILEHIMGGIRYMLPCVVAGGILMGIGYMVDSYHLNPQNYGYNTALAAFFSKTGNAVFGFMLPLLAAFIGSHIAGIDAIPAGLAGGYLAHQDGSGFLGALLAGFLAGYFIRLLQKLLKRLPESLEGLKTLLLLPLLSVLFMGAATFGFLDPVIGLLNRAMNHGLQSMNGTSKVLLGFVVGTMEAADMGGPINKTAYLFATASLANGQYDIMAAVLAGGIVPPYVTALSSTIFKNKFTKSQRQQGFTNYIIGLAGITEAAIPFMVEDPTRVIPCCMLGSGIAGALSMLFRCSVMAPFGGVFILPLNSKPLLYVVSVMTGIAVGTVLLGISKRKIL